MGRTTVKRRIFYSNALMVLVTLVVFLAINTGTIWICMEMMEQEVKAIIEENYGRMTEDEVKDSLKIYLGREDLEQLFSEWVKKRNMFLLLFGMDGLLCVGALTLVSQLFTANLTRHIMEPLDALKDGAQRVRYNDLGNEIVYVGEIEFENVCMAFNDMQKHILEEQEKNRRYEKARTDMIVGISHDLRTPLTAVKGMIKGLMDGIAATPGQQRQFLEAAYRRTGDMDILLNQLFYLSKLETGNMPIQMQKIEMGSFLRRYVRRKRELPENEAVEFEEDFGREQVYAQADPEQMQRILDNLVENSRKYAQTGHVKIRLSMHAKKELLHICFRDNGVGIAEEKLSHIFEKFYRGDESRNQREGNGLGLYIVKYLIEAMNGSVWAENESGLMISIELPLAAAGIDAVCNP